MTKRKPKNVVKAETYKGLSIYVPEENVKVPGVEESLPQAPKVVNKPTDETVGVVKKMKL